MYACIYYVRNVCLLFMYVHVLYSFICILSILSLVCAVAKVIAMRRKTERFFYFFSCISILLALQLSLRYLLEFVVDDIEGSILPSGVWYRCHLWPECACPSMHADEHCLYYAMVPRVSLVTSRGSPSARSTRLCRRAMAIQMRSRPTAPFGPSSALEKP